MHPHDARRLIAAQKESYPTLCLTFVPLAVIIGVGIASMFVVDVGAVIAPESVRRKTGMLTEMLAAQVSLRAQNEKPKGAAVTLMRKQKREELLISFVIE